MMDQQDSTKKHVLLSYDTLAQAESVKEYLLKNLRIAGDLGIEIEHRDPATVRGQCNVWALMICEHFKSFSTSVRKCQEAAQDYFAGLQEGKALFLRKWRGTLTTRAYRGITPIKWPDPVGFAAGLTCKRVAVNKDGRHYIRVWKDVDGTSAEWMDVYSETTLNEFLAKPSMLPVPTWYYDI